MKDVDFFLINNNFSYPCIPTIPSSCTDFTIRVYPLPKASITWPKDGDVFEELDDIYFQGSYRVGGTADIKWVSSIDGDIYNGSTTFYTYNLSAGNHNITFEVTDITMGLTAIASVNITINPPPSLKAKIISPKNESAFSYGELISFDSLAAGGIPPYIYSWASNIDGSIENLQTFTKNNLSVGNHMINLTVTDFNGETDTKIIEVYIPPDYFDWRNVNGSNWMTSVKSQRCSDCWAFATVGVIEAKYNIQKNNPDLDIDLSEQYIVSDCCSAGNCIIGGRAAFFCVKNSGIANESCYGYLGKNSICPSTCDDGTAIGLWKINEFRAVGSKTRAKVQAALVRKGPLYTTIDATPMPDTGRDDEDGCNIYSCGGGSIDHAVVLVGYNDSGRYWIIKNSWGGIPDNPCEDGFESLDYDGCNTIINQGVYIEEVLLP